MAQPRPAVANDAPELVRLREIMLTAITGTPPEPGPWATRAVEAFRRRLADPSDSLTGFVIDKTPPDRGLAAGVIGVIDHRLPTPENPTGTIGHVFNVATDADYRRQGYARACMTALLDWYRQHGVTQIDLHATTEGTPLYHSLGFQPAQCPALRLALE